MTVQRKTYRVLATDNGERWDIVVAEIQMDPVRDPPPGVQRSRQPVRSLDAPTKRSLRHRAQRPRGTAHARSRLIAS
jgi:hypothetical protein